MLSQLAWSSQPRWLRGTLTPSRCLSIGSHAAKPAARPGITSRTSIAAGKDLLPSDPGKRARNLAVGALTFAEAACLALALR